LCQIVGNSPPERDHGQGVIGREIADFHDAFARDLAAERGAGEAFDGFVEIAFEKQPLARSTPKAQSRLARRGSMAAIGLEAGHQIRAEGLGVAPTDHLKSWATDHMRSCKLAG
jgi:hypothetical protein